MKHLIRNTEELQMFTRVNISVLKQSFLPYEQQAQNKYIKKYLGATLLNELALYHNTPQNPFPQWADSPEKKDAFKELLQLVQSTLANFTLYVATPHMDLHLSELGFIVASTDNTAPASSQRVDRAQAAYLNQGYDSLETMLEFLEENHNLIASYSQSQHSILAANHFINTAKEFDRIIPINQSRLRFLAMKADMDNIEKLYIHPAISTELSLLLIKQKRENNLTPQNKKLCELVCRCIANLVIAQADKPDFLKDNENFLGFFPESPQAKQKYKGYGLNYLAAAKQIVRTNADDYPLYRNSSVFIQNPMASAYQNNDESETKIFVFGQPHL